MFQVVMPDAVFSSGERQLPCFDSLFHEYVPLTGAASVRRSKALELFAGCSGLALPLFWQHDNSIFGSNTLECLTANVRRGGGKLKRGMEEPEAERH